MTKLENIGDILWDALAKNEASLDSCKVNGDTLEVNYIFYVNSGGDMSGTVSVDDFEETGVYQIIKNVAHCFFELYDNFDEDDFVRMYMDVEGSPCIRDLLGDSEELCNFYENMFIDLNKLSEGE